MLNPFMHKLLELERGVLLHVFITTNQMSTCRRALFSKTHFEGDMYVTTTVDTHALTESIHLKRDL